MLQIGGKVRPMPPTPSGAEGDVSDQARSVLKGKQEILVG